MNPTPRRSQPFRTARTHWPRRRGASLARRPAVSLPSDDPGREFDLARSVIGKAGREQPADRVLREVLRAQHNLTRAQSAVVSHAVFAYYRWLGWLGDEQGEEAKLRRALELNQAFKDNPRGLSDEALRTRAVPAWIRDEMEVDDAWLRILQSEPTLWLRARPGQGRALAERLLSRASPLLPDAVAYDGDMDLFQTEEFKMGDFEIQDIASQAVGRLCAPKPGETWWDACAGEGGKLLHLSDLMANKGLIWASDRAEWRLKKLRQRAARARAFNYRVALWEGGDKLPTKTKFDGVLVDAPCSGVGTWQRNPHARWTTTPNDVRELAAVQNLLLAKVAPAVNPGGKLVYSVCTLTHAETRAVAEEFNRLQPQFEPLPLSLPTPDRARSSSTADTVTAGFCWPQELRGNGMFIAAWRRRM